MSKNKKMSQGIIMYHNTIYRFSLVICLYNVSKMKYVLTILNIYLTVVWAPTFCKHDTNIIVGSLFIYQRNTDTNNNFFTCILKQQQCMKCLSSNIIISDRKDAISNIC